MKKIILIAAALAAAAGLRAQPISGPLDICTGASYTYTDTALGGAWTSGSPSVASIDSFSGVITGGTPGVALITYYYFGGGSSSVSVTVHGLPAAITGTATVCTGATTTLSDATPGGLWSSANNAVAMVDDSTGMVVGTGADTVSLFYTGAFGCSRSMVVTVNPAPTAIVAAASYCTGVSDTLYETGGGTWTTGTPALITLGASTGSIVGNAAGVADVTYTLTTGCATSATITINPSPHAGTISAYNFVCIGGSVSCTSDSCCGIWSSSNPAVETVSATGVVTGVSAGLAIISYNVTNSCGTATAVKGVQVVSDVDCTKLSVKKITGAEGELSVIPNPAPGGSFALQFSSETPGPAQAIITNALGEKVKEVTIEANKKNDITIDGPAGIYLIQVSTTTGKYNTKVVVE